ncbi:hypothetical protein [Bradyrhizobium erythrophlei]|uniref:Peptidase family M41 n=1 Tax=Bradyrhizobium erythrophlei TaxID=1437360 RepID=A0A1M5YJ84_9BRAD|nr:hypothetical protein [Bradyrhizobium erythrophlei]SHI11988.1 hypothetical protein SAMN05443248_8382 [Bradyrhizobium erythrophlei]
MTEGIPADEVPEQLAASPAGTVTAAGVGVGNTDDGGGHEGVDEYDTLLAVLGRSHDDDERIAVHEAGHIVVARLLGHPLGGATVDPGPGYEGRVWGEGHVEAFTNGRGDASHVREAIAPLMPKPGEDRGSVADVFGSVYDQCVELMAGRAAERMLLEGEPGTPVDDLRQARELAMLICTSEKSIETFIAHCDVAAWDLLLPYGDVVTALCIVLRIKRTLDGAEIDKIIADLEARKAVAVEHRHRADWRKRVSSANSFQAGWAE